MSGISDPGTCRRITILPVALLGMVVICLAFCTADARAADIENGASYQPAAIQPEAQTVDSQGMPGGPLMFYATISTIVASFAALMLALIAFAHVAKTNKRMSQLSQVKTDPSAIGQQQKLTEAIDLISAIDYRLSGLERRIDDRLGQWDQFEARLNATEAETEKAGWRLSQNYAALQQVNVRMDAVTQDIEALRAFRDTVKAIRDQIVGAIGPSQTNVQQEQHPVTGEQADETEQDSVTSDEQEQETSEADSSGEESSTDIMKYYYPGGAGSGFSR